MIDHEIKDLRFMVMFDPTDGKILCLLALDWDEMKHLGGYKRTRCSDGWHACILVYRKTGTDVCI
jgi:hypothetical protein